MKYEVKLTVIYLCWGAPLVTSVVMSVVVHHTTTIQTRALRTALCKALSSEGSQGFLQAFPGLLAETSERQIYEWNSETRTS